MRIALNIFPEVECGTTGGDRRTFKYKKNRRSQGELRTAACYGGMGYGVNSNCMKLLGAEAEGVRLVAVEDVAGVDFFAHIVERWIVAVGYDGIGLLLKGG